MALTQKLKDEADADRSALMDQMTSQKLNDIKTRDGKPPQLPLQPSLVPEDVGGARSTDDKASTNGRKSYADDGFTLPSTTMISTAIDEYKTPNGDRGCLCRQMTISEEEVWIRVIDEDGYAPYLAFDWTAMDEDTGKSIINDTREDEGRPLLP